MTILVIDAQGGGVGKQLVAALRAQLPQARILAVGTNTAATAAMLKAGAHEAATGENSVAVACRRADIIVGPVGIVIADSLLGEVTPKMALSVAQSAAKRVFIPFNHCDNVIVGVADRPSAALIGQAVSEVVRMAQEG